MVSLYLALRHPERYASHDYPIFTAAWQAFQPRNIPTVSDMERFFKGMCALYELLAKDPEIMRLHCVSLRKGVHFQGDSLLLPRSSAASSLTHSMNP